VTIEIGTPLFDVYLTNLFKYQKIHAIIYKRQYFVTRVTKVRETQRFGILRPQWALWLYNDWWQWNDKK